MRQTFSCVTTARRAGVLAALFAATITARAIGVPQDVTALEGVRVIVGDGRAPIENATVVISGGRITQVGLAAGVKVPTGAARVNLAGKTIMPTIIDTHVHLGTTRDALVMDLSRRASFGIGAALSLGLDPPGDVFAVRAAPPAGGARYLTAGRGITMPEQGRTTVPYWVTTETEARTAVREQAALKVDFVKIWVDDRNGQFQKMPPAIYTAVIDEAHRARLRVAAHIFNLSDAKGLLQAGLDAFAHGVRDLDVDDAFIAMVKARRGLVLIPNMPDRGVAADYGWLRGQVSDGELAKIQAAATDRPQAQVAWSIQARNLKRMSDAGVTVVVGTDGNTAWAPHVEMADMVAAGMTPMQVIVAATKNGAEFLRLTDTGTIEAGKRADFLVLDGNPAEDITNTRRISAVYLRGARIQR